ncbi:DUF6134 family protein [Ferrovibrio sp. MS7]|uniref:DUF6134 family protein n=1 Tax=Ferrovibrio plantarum TaxID=3119164 RepID=UPI0031368672
MGKALFLILMLLVTGLLLQPVSAMAATTEQWAFRAIRKGEDIGHHNVTVTRRDGEARATVDISLIVRAFGFLPLYHYHHKSQELWRDGRLVNLESTTDDNGTQHYVKAFATADGVLQIEGSRFKGSAPADVMTTSYWNNAFPRHKLLLDTQSGRLLVVTVAEQPLQPEEGVPPDARHYRLDGDLRLELWYDAARRWIKNRFRASDGSVIDYRLAP